MLAPRSLRCLTAWGYRRIILTNMSEAKPKVGVEQELKQLEHRLDELLGTITQLHEENRALRQRQDSMMAERANLLQKNEQVRARVEAMIGRLKAMEHSA
jgi:cell division protein ZapB